MGVHLVTSDAAKAFAAREKVMGRGISLLGIASSKVKTLDKATLEQLGDVSAELVPHALGTTGKLFHVTARLLWATAGVKEKEAKFVDILELDKKIEKLEKKVVG
ncbi:Uncharacterised protein [uncultured archaeon]|nr:Uncharacterised protein [uncultured archaeon]